MPKSMHDEDIITIDTSTPSQVQPIDPITHARARQLNYQFSIACRNKYLVVGLIMHPSRFTIASGVGVTIAKEKDGGDHREIRLEWREEKGIWRRMGERGWRELVPRLHHMHDPWGAHRCQLIPDSSSKFCYA
uniref:Uncharacterized protein n=1 Tax=Oryza brachyantha TaxID=4533 RepID=J3LS05_ORYBR